MDKKIRTLTKTFTAIVASVSLSSALQATSIVTQCPNSSRLAATFYTNSLALFDEYIANLKKTPNLAELKQSLLDAGYPTNYYKSNQGLSVNSNGCTAHILTITCDKKSCQH